MRNGTGEHHYFCLETHQNKLNGMLLFSQKFDKLWLFNKNKFHNIS